MVSILMATYNGAQYLSEQLESILAQSYQNFVLYIKDDYSTDETVDILIRYKAKYPDKIQIFYDYVNSGCAKYNFLDLMLKNEINFEYTMLADQDDIWLPNKIEVSLKAMHELEQQYGNKTPLLVHTDAILVDQNLSYLSNSYIKTMKVDYTKTQISQQIVQNTLMGSTALYNKALQTILEYPKFTVMHDWWLMLSVCAFGKVRYVDTATMLYRQHANNQVGIRNMNSLRFIMYFATQREVIHKALIDSCFQSDAFLSIYADKLSISDRKFLEEYSNIPNMNKINKIKTVIKNKAFKNGIARKIGQIIYI